MLNVKRRKLKKRDAHFLDKHCNMINIFEVNTEKKIIL